MVALAFNEMRERTGDRQSLGSVLLPAPQGSACMARGRACQPSERISPPFKTCLGSGKEREQFSSMWREPINTATSIVLITGLRLIWCLLLFHPCSAPVLLAASRLGQR